MNKDYLYLANLNLKRNKKRTIRIIGGLSVGISLLIISLYVFFSIYFGLINYVNNDRFVNSVSVDYTNNENRNIFENLDGIINKCNYGIINSPGLEFDIDGKKYENAVASLGFSVDELCVNEVENYFEYRYNEIIRNNRYNTITTEKKFLLAGSSDINDGEILISKFILDSIKVDYKEVINKKISFKIAKNNINNHFYYNDGSETKESVFDEDYFYVLKDFTIKGIYNSNCSYYPYSGNYIINSKSIYKPKLIKTENHVDQTISQYDKLLFFQNGKNSSYNYYYDNDLNYYENIVNNDKKMLAIEGLTYGGDLLYERLFFNDFRNTINAYYKLKNLYSNDGVINYQFNSISDLMNYKNIVDTIIIFFGIISLFIIVISIFGVFSVINYDIEKKKNYIGMLKALGLKNNGVFKLYFSEFSLYVFKSMIISIVLSLIISLAFIFITNFGVLKYMGFTISFWYYFLALGIVILFFILISYLYTYIVTKHYVKGKITNLLKE